MRKYEHKIEFFGSLFFVIKSVDLKTKKWYTITITHYMWDGLIGFVFYNGERVKGKEIEKINRSAKSWLKKEIKRLEQEHKK